MEQQNIGLTRIRHTIDSRVSDLIPRWGEKAENRRITSNIAVGYY